MQSFADLRKGLIGEEGRKNWRIGIGWGGVKLGSVGE